MAVVMYVFPVEKYNHSAVRSCLLIKIKKNYNFIDRKNPSSQIFVLHRSSKSIQCNMHYIQGTLNNAIIIIFLSRIHKSNNVANSLLFSPPLWKWSLLPLLPVRGQSYTLCMGN